MNQFLSSAYDFFARIAALALSIVFILASLATLTLMNVAAQLFNPAFYTQTLASVALYERIPALAAQQILYTGTDDAPEYIRNLTADDFEAILKDVLPPDWVQTQVEHAAEETFAYLNGDINQLEILIPMHDIKNQLRGEAGVDLILRFLRAQEACTVEQIQTLTQIDFISQPEAIPICAPPEILVAQYQPAIQTALDDAIKRIPNYFEISELPDGSNLGEPLEPLRQVIRIARVSLLGGFALSVAALLMIALLVVRSIQAWLRWWGIPIMISGGAAFLVGAGAFLFLRVWTRSVFQLSPDVTATLAPELIELFGDIAAAGARSFLLPMTLLGGVAAVVGLGMWVASFFLGTLNK